MSDLEQTKALFEKIGLDFYVEDTDAYGKNKVVLRVPCDDSQDDVCRYIFLDSGMFVMHLIGKYNDYRTR